MHNVAESVKNLTIKSLAQSVQNQDIIIFEGQVEALIGKTFHLWADRVHVDKKNLIATAAGGSRTPVKLESNDFVMLADELVLDLAKKTGHAKNLKIHIQEGFLSADRAEKKSDNEWSMRDMVYTACDADHSHWHLSAVHAYVKSNYLVCVSGVLLRVGGLPIFGLPRMAFPIQGHSHSGFLIPKIYFDYDNGFGFKQEYYQYFGPHADTTLGIDWNDQKGIVFTDEFRWARSPESYALFKGHYAIVQNAYKQESGKIFSGTQHRYWVEGKDFYSFDLPALKAHVSSLLCVDFGTDKRIGYQFFNTIQDIDDVFYNAWLFRILWPRDVINLGMGRTRTQRQQFADLSGNEKEILNGLVTVAQLSDPKITPPLVQKKEYENRVIITQLPYFSWNSAYARWGGIFAWRHDLFVDQIDYREEELARLFVYSLFESEENIVPLNHAMLVRLNYQSWLQALFPWAGHALRVAVQPVAQVRSLIEKDRYLNNNVIEKRLFAHGSWRLFATSLVEWSLPELSFTSESWRSNYFVQPLVRWEYVPRFDQDHWFYIDKLDRFYAQNEISAGLSTSMMLNDVGLDIEVTQGYDFNRQCDIFPLKRGVGASRFLPFHCSASLQHSCLQSSVTQEWDIYAGKLMHSYFLNEFLADRVSLGAGYLYQAPDAQRRWGLLANTPHFLIFNGSMPLSKQFAVHYDGQFYAEKGKQFFGLAQIKPLLHKVRLEYEGHCWGFYVGYEEKKYREIGIEKSERALIFSLRLDSLGSFAKKFKRPKLHQ
ncbi:LPS-assembly protein LptD [bacterium]|nr:MAG: LPS-assembly protein LptD [bacterium]